MKILVIGDIHGRNIWKKIISKEDFDKVVFLGDYVSTHDGISSRQQLVNLEEILEYKEKNPKKVILLRGNHDLQHLGYGWAECSGLDRKVLSYMSRPEFKDRFESLTQWVYISKKTIFSHAGISEVWMRDIALIDNVEEILSMPISEKFAFTPSSLFDYCGTSSTQPPTWIRPTVLARVAIPGYTQVVGHTPVKTLTNMSKAVRDNLDIFLCDTLGIGQYLVLENSVPEIKQICNEDMS